MQIVIPTYNRSGKLLRTLECYASVRALFRAEIVILDGSDESHRSANRRSSAKYSCRYIEGAKGSGMLQRVHTYLSTLHDVPLVCLATDEDVFLPTYLEMAEKFLLEHSDYSMFVGRYITFQRPLAFFGRISDHRDTVLGFDIAYPTATRRIAMISNLVRAGCSPVYWGIRRTHQLVASLGAQMQLEYESTQEMADQIIVASDGKIRFDATPMLLRDETNIDYVVLPNRHDARYYLGLREQDDLLRVVGEVCGPDALPGAQLFMDTFLPFRGEQREFPSVSVAISKKAYSRFEPFFSSSGDRFSKLHYLWGKASTVFGEILTYYYFLLKVRSIYPESLMSFFVKRVKSNEYPG